MLPFLFFLSGAMAQDCPAYHFKINGVDCVGIQQFPGAEGCGLAAGGQDGWPEALSRQLCEEFGTPRDAVQVSMRTWGNLSGPTTPQFNGDVNQPRNPPGCLRHSNQNIYVWNTATRDASLGLDRWWRPVCKQREVAQSSPPTEPVAANCLDLRNAHMPQMDARFNTLIAGCLGSYSPLSPPKAFNDKIFTQDGGSCWAYLIDRQINRYRFVTSAMTDVNAQYANPSSATWGVGNFYKIPDGNDLLENTQCAAPADSWNPAPAPSPAPGPSPAPAPSGPPAPRPGFEFKGAGTCVDGSRQAYANMWSNFGPGLTALKCMEICQKYNGCVGVTTIPPLAGTTLWKCTLIFEPNRGFAPTAVDQSAGVTGWQRVSDTWAEWVGGIGAQHHGRGAVAGVAPTTHTTPGMEAYCFAKQDLSDPCASGSARFGCCPQLPYGRLDAGRRASQLATCTTTGEPHIIDFSGGFGQTTTTEGDFVLYEGALLEVSVRQVGFRAGSQTLASGNNAWVMTGALIGYNTIEWFGAARLTAHQTVASRSTTEVYWNGVATSTQELCDVHLQDFACWCRRDSQVQISSPRGSTFPPNVNQHIEIVFNEDYMFRATTWWDLYGWMDIVLTVDPLNVGKPGMKLNAVGVQEFESGTIARGTTTRGGLCTKGGIIPDTQLLNYKIDCTSAEAFLINRLGGSMKTHDLAHAAAYCYRRRREEPIDRRMDLQTAVEHVADVLNGCDSSLQGQAEDFCKICDTAKLLENCVFDACATKSLRGAQGSRNFCQEKLLIAAKPGEEASICDAEQIWDVERQICRHKSWSPEAKPVCTCRQSTASHAEGARCVDPLGATIDYRQTVNWCCSDYGCSKGYKWVIPDTTPPKKEIPAVEATTMVDSVVPAESSTTLVDPVVPLTPLAPPKPDTTPPKKDDPTPAKTGCATGRNVRKCVAMPNCVWKKHAPVGERCWNKDACEAKTKNTCSTVVDCVYNRGTNRCALKKNIPCSDYTKARECVHAMPEGAKLGCRWNKDASDKNDHFCEEQQCALKSKPAGCVKLGCEWNGSKCEMPSSWPPENF